MAVLDADIGLDDAAYRIDDQRVGDHGIDAVGAHALALPHAVADDLAAAEFNLLAENGVVFFDFGEQLGIGQAYAVALAVDGGGAEDFGISAARYGYH